MKLISLAHKTAAVAVQLAHLLEKGADEGTDWEQAEALVREISQLSQAMDARAKEEGVFVVE